MPTHRRSARASLRARCAARSLLAVVALVVMASVTPAPGAAEEAPAGEPPTAATARGAAEALVARYGAGEGERARRGVAAVLRLWRPEDGDAAAFRSFVEQEFVPRGTLLDQTFDRFEFAMERIGGYMQSLVRDLRSGADLDRGPLLPLDRRLAGYDPGAHVADDLFANQVAFVALLNFPPSSLEERLRDGMEWSRRRWAEERLGGSFDERVPAAVNQAIAAAFASADAYIAGYNVYMHHLLTADGERLFPEGLRLISHWGLRDELKARYADPDGLPKQRLIARVMDAIVRQQIPAAVVDNPLLDWTPETGAVALSPVHDAEAPPGAASAPATDREPDERYRQWLAVFHAERQADPYSPENPTFVDRRFNVDREIPEAEVRALFGTLLTAPEGARTAALIARRLERPLEPFDVWYVGFRARGRYEEAQLDALTEKRYPTADAYAADIPRLLTDLGFSDERAHFVADHIVVEPSRGAGHAFGAARRDDLAHLRTRVGPHGMDYKGYNIAVHEMGHNVEQVFSTTLIDHSLLHGVPNNAFTEALAFVFQGRDLELLGLAGRDEESARLDALDTFWAAREIAGVGLVDMDSWRWLYAHPDATPAEFRQAVVEIAQGIWNRYYADLLGARDQTLLAVYSHLIDSGLYTPDYPLGHLIAFQVEDHFAHSGKPLGEEFERVARLGRLTPDAWMRQAVGGPLSAAPLLAAARSALDAPAPAAAIAPAAAVKQEAPSTGPGDTGGAELVVREGFVPSADGVSIHYLSAGPGRGADPAAPALVLIHCWSCDATYWTRELARFSAQRRVVAVDLGGHGESGMGRERWTMQAFGEDVAAVVRALDLKKVILVGHSMGGFVMLEAARRLPGTVVGMIAVDTLHDVEETWDGEAMAKYVAALENDFPATVKKQMASYFHPAADPALVDRVTSDMAAEPKQVGVSAFRELLAYRPDRALDALHLPLRAINSARIPTNVEADRRHSPGFDYVALDGTGHWPMFEVPAAFEAALARWVDELSARP
jgi:pimeloyl-ACP methyl ester carboxylesterase